MRLSRPRFTVRSLIVLVAVAAITSGVLVYVERMKRLSQQYRERALNHYWQEMTIGTGQKSGYNGKVLSPDPSGLVSYHAQLREKYERAARYPWLPVEPDPMPPASAVKSPEGD